MAKTFGDLIDEGLDKQGFDMFVFFFFAGINLMVLTLVTLLLEKLGVSFGMFDNAFAFMVLMFLVVFWHVIASFALAFRYALKQYRSRG